MDLPTWPLQADASIGVRPQTRARRASSGVPANEVSDSYSISPGNDLAVLTGIDKMERLAVAHHAVLDGRGRGVCWRRRSGGTLDAGTEVVAGPHASTGGTAYTRVPGGDLSDNNADAAGDGGAGVAGLDKVPAVAVVDHACLDRLGRGVRRRRLRGRTTDYAGA